jgi:hypothetical protein
MSLLEKASGGKKTKNAKQSPAAHTSLFKRAMAASRSEAEFPPPSSSVAPESAIELSPQIPANPFFADSEAMDELKDKLLSLHPSYDSMLAAWSLLSARLPLQAISLFLPHGDFLALAAQVGFPSGRSEDLPLYIAPSTDQSGLLLGDEVKALVAPSLGVGLDMSLRAVSMRSEPGLRGLWIFHDDPLEASPDDDRFRLIELLGEAASSLPGFTMASVPADTVTLLLSKLDKYRCAIAIRFDLGSTYADLAAYRGLNAQALRSALVVAAEKILEQTGAALAFGEASIVAVLGSSAKCDPELSLFQFTKTLRRSLPFLSAEAFPAGSAMGFDPSSERASEELSRFLAI